MQRRNSSDVFPDEICELVLSYLEMKWIVKGCALISKQFYHVSKTIKFSLTLGNTLLADVMVYKSVKPFLTSEYMENLTELNMRGILNGRECVLEIAQSPHFNNLTKLTLDRTVGVSKGCFKQFGSKLSQLTCLKVANNENGKPIVQSIVDAQYELTQLHLQKCNIDSESITSICSCETMKLESLDLYFNEFEKEVVKTIAENTVFNLTYLNLSSNMIGDYGATMIATSHNMSNLKSLHLHYCGISRKGCDAISHSDLLQNLETLDIGNNDAGTKAITNLLSTQNLPNLTYLYITKTIREYESCPPYHCQYMKHLKHLIMESNLEPVKVLSKLSTTNLELTHLNLNKTTIHRPLFEVLSNSKFLSRLTTLGLCETHITEECLGLLVGSEHMSNLTSLDLASCSLTKNGVANVCNSANMKNLKTINLMCNNIGNGGVKHIAESPLMSQLTCLNLESTKIKDSAVKRLTSSANMSQLRELSLSRNNIGLEGVKMLISCTNQMKSLHKLNISYNAFGERGMKLLTSSDFAKNLWELKANQLYMKE